MHQPSFDGVWIKVERAKEHIRNLEMLHHSFLQSEPYEIIRDNEPDTGDWVYRVKVKAQPPIYWSAIVGDAIHDLRASLDVLIWQLVLVNGRKPDRMRTGFPISESADEFRAKGLRKIKGVPDEAVHLVKAAKPYKGGNDALWRLHHLDIRDKHRLLIPVGSAVKALVLDFGMMLRHVLDETGWDDVNPADVSSMPVHLPAADREYPLKDGTELYRVPIGGQNLEMNKYPQFTFEVAFGEGEIVQGEPLVPTLHQLANFVEGFVEPFRALFSQR